PAEPAPTLTELPDWQRPIRELAAVRALQEQGHWSEAAHRLHGLEDKELPSYELYLTRGQLHGALGQLTAAAADFARAFPEQVPGEPGDALQYALLRCYLGDTAGYRQLRRQIAQQLPRTSSPPATSHALRALTCASKDDSVPRRLVAWVEDWISAPSYW